MPRKSRSASRPATKTAPAAQRDSSEEATTSKKRTSKQPATPKAPKTPVAERVTRRSTRPAATKRPVYSDGSESSEEEEVVPKKRGRQSSPRKAPMPSRGRGRPSTKDIKKKVRSPRKSRKNESDDESEESLDLGDSEEDEPEADDDEEEEAPVAKKTRGPPARRGARGGSRGTDDAASRAGIGTDKSSPSVVLERVEGGAKAGGSKGSRGRPARSSRAVVAKGRRGGRADSEEEDDDEEDEANDDEEESDGGDDVIVAKSSVGTSSRPKRGAVSTVKPTGKTPTAAPARRRGAPRKMVPSEENAAAPAATEDEEVAAVKKDSGDKKADAGDAAEKKEPKTGEDAVDKVADKKDTEKSDETMDVDDEPDKDKKPAAEDATEAKKHKLDEVAADAILPPAKRTRSEEEVEEKEAPTAEDVKTKDIADGAAVSKAEDKKETDTAINGSAAPKDEDKDAEPKVNGDATTPAAANNISAEHESVMSASLGVALPRRCVSGEGNSGDGERFSLVSYNLACEDLSSKHASLVAEVVALRPSILCLQEVDETYFKSSLDSALKGHGYMGLYKPGRTPAKGLATFYLLSAFEILHHKELEVHDLLDKDVQASNLSDSEKDAVKSFLHSPAPVLITKLKSISNGKSVTVGTIHLPSDDESLLAVQVSAVIRELLSVSEGSKNPHVLCGSFNLGDDSAIQQLLRDGSLKNEVLDELKKKATVPVPEKENASLAALLAASFQHPSSCLKSSYGSILGHEFKFPDKNQKLSRDSLWFSSDSLSTKSILDAGPPVDSVTTPSSGVHVSLKAELGFVN